MASLWKQQPGYEKRKGTASLFRCPSALQSVRWVLPEDTAVTAQRPRAGGRAQAEPGALAVAMVAAGRCKASSGGSVSRVYTTALCRRLCLTHAGERRVHAVSPLPPSACLDITG